MRTAIAILAATVLASCGQQQPSANQAATADPLEEFYVLIESDDDDAMREWIKQQPRLNLKAIGDRNLLTYAISRSSQTTVEALLTAGADIEARDHFGDTPLTAAIEANSREIFRLLLQRGADPNRTFLKIHNGIRTELAPLNLALVTDEEHVQDLLEAGADVNQEGLTISIPRAAVRHASPEVLPDLLERLQTPIQPDVADVLHRTASLRAQHEPGPDSEQVRLIVEGLLQQEN